MQIMFWNNNKLEKRYSHLHKALSSSFGNVKHDTNLIFQWLNYFYEKNLQYEQQIMALRQELSYFPKSKEQLKGLLDEYYSYEPILKKIQDLNERINDLKKQKSTENEPLIQQLEGLNKEVEKSKKQRLDESESFINNLHELDKKIEQSKTQIFEEKDSILNNFKELDDKLELFKSQRLQENESILKKTHELDARLEALKSGFEPQKSPQNLEEIKARLSRLEQKKIAIKEKIIKRITKNSKEYVKTIILSYIKKYEKISALQLKEMIVEEQGLCSKSSFYRILEEIEQLEDIATIKKGKEKHYMVKKVKLE